MVRKTDLPYDGRVAFVTANNCSIVAHPDSKECLRNITDFDAVDKQKTDEALKKGKVIQGIGVDKSGTNIMTILYPFEIMENTASWYFGLLLPKNEVMESFTLNLYKILAISAIGLFTSVEIIIFVSGNIVNYLQRITNFSIEIAKGNYTASVITTGFTREIFSLKYSLANMVTSLLETIKKAKKSQRAAKRGLQKAEIVMA